MAKAILTDDAHAALELLTNFMEFSGLAREDIATLIDAEQMVDVVKREEPNYEFSVADIVNWWTVNCQGTAHIQAESAKRWMIDLTTTPKEN
jgi:hypothetical protein